MGSNALNDYSNSENEFWIFGYGSLIWKPPPHFDRRIPGYVTGYVRRFWQVNSQPHDKTSPLTSLLPQSPSPNPKPNTNPIHLTPLSLIPSEDHRGTPTSPGRVVTLIPHAHWLTLHDPHPIPSETTSPKVWGTAYRILTSKVAEVREYLDIREINGYTIHYTPFYPSSSTFINSDNESGGATSIRTLVYIGTPDNAQFTGPQDPQKLAEHIWRSEGPSGLNRDYLLSLDIALDELSPESGDEHVKDLANRVRKIAMGHRGVEAEASHSKAIEHELKKVKSTDEQEETEK